MSPNLRHGHQLRDKILDELLPSEYASGSNFSRTAVDRAFQLYHSLILVDDKATSLSAQDFQELEAESKVYIKSSRQLLNMYLILSGLALI